MSNPPTDFPPFEDDEFSLYAPPARRLPEIPGIQPLDEPPRWGGFGTVFKATETVLKRTVAVKVEHQRSEGVAEAVKLAQYQHPNIVTVHRTGGTPDGRRYVILEWLSGGSLAERLGSGARLSPRGWAELFEKVALAVDAVHTAGTIHRDIKPHNILFASDDPSDWFLQPKLADFGLAVTGTVLSDGSGTRAYMAPEQRAGFPTRFSDVYSLGLTLWECLTTARAREDGMLPVPLPLTGVPKTLGAIIRNCLAEHLLDRYGSRDLEPDDERQRPALEMAKDLRRFLEHRPTQARPLRRSQRVALWAQRSPWQAVAFATLGVGLTFISWFAFRLAEANDRLQTETDAKLAKEREVAEVNRKLLIETDAKLTKERETAEANRKLLAATQRELAEKRLSSVQRYAAQLKIVQDHLAVANSADAVAELDRCPSELRGWEWDHLRGRCDTALSRVKFPTGIQAIAVQADGRVAVATQGAEVYVGQWGSELPASTPFRESSTREHRGVFLARDRLVTASLTKRGEVVASVLDSRSLTGPNQRDEPERDLFTPGEYVANVPASPIQVGNDTIVRVGQRGTLKITDMATGRTRIAVENVPPATALAFKSDNKNRMLAALVDQTVRFWSWPELRPLAPLTPQRGRLIDLGFTADGTLVLIGGADDASDVSLWTFDKEWKLAKDQPSDRRNGITRVWTNPVANFFVTTGRALSVWSRKEGGMRCKDLLGHSNQCTAVAFNPDGQRVFTGSRGGEVKEFIVEPALGKQLAGNPMIVEPDLKARIIDTRVQMNDKFLELNDGGKPRGLLVERREDGATRLLILYDGGRVVSVDTATGVTVFP